MNATFSVAIVGLDHWYTALLSLDILAKSETITLTTIWETDESRWDDIKKRAPHATLTADAADVFANPDIQLVLICADTARASDLALSALESGKHVVSVKPCAMSLANLDNIIAVAEQSGRFYGSFEGMQRLSPRATMLKELIASGAIGTPLSYYQLGHGGLPSPWPGQPSGAPSWWIDSARSPMGAWADHAIYAVDLARFVFGELGEREVRVLGSQLANRLHPTLAHEDYGVALMQLGMVNLIIEDTWAVDNAAGGVGMHRTHIMGTKGNILAEGNTWVVTNADGKTVHPLPDTPYFDYDTLVTHLQTGTAPHFSLPFGPEDARAALAACLVVYGK
jgi:predicted dehydrogenase